MKNVLVLGGGAKESSIAEHLGKTVNVMRFEKDITDEALMLCDVIILPLPASNGEFVTGTNIELKRLFKYPNKTIIGGRITGDFEKFSDKCKLIDYTSSEVFAIKNAVPTVEAAISIAINNTPITIHNSRCLITGYGRIAKILARYLKAMGACVTCCIRNISQIAGAESDGFSVINKKEITNQHWDIIFNTVPAVIFDEKTLVNLSAGIIIDLASTPGGCDFDAAKKLSINIIHALALPGKTAPVTAAKIIADTIISLKE